MCLKNIVYNFPMRPVMILFAKAPIAGSVKTRLIGTLGAPRAAELHSALVLDMIEKLNIFRGFADIELHTSITTDAWRETLVTRKVQCPGGLELKLFHALDAALAEGRSQAMVIGSDAPTLPGAHLKRLLNATADVALGPCEDGGFYAIACRHVRPEMFSGVRWSAPETLGDTLAAVKRCGLSVELGDLWYDIDEPADLERLRREHVVPVRTKQVVEG